jgi:lysophospholipase L1-like esterase
MRVLLRATGKLAAIGLGALAIEAAYAVLRPAPLLEEFNPSALIGRDDGVPLRLVVLGDSSCTGPGVDLPDEIWSRLLAGRLARAGFKVELVSLATGGATSASVLKEQVPVAQGLKADVTIVSVGTNDLIRRVALRSLESNLDEIVSRMKPVSRIVMLAGIGDLGTIPRLLPPLSQIVTRHARMADVRHARVAQRHSAVKAEQWGKAAEIFRTDRSVFSRDRFHPTATGHRAWADAAWEALEPVLAGLATRDQT